MLSAIATDSNSIVKPDSEKKLLCARFGLPTESCTQSRTPWSSSSLMAIRLRLTRNFSPRVSGHGSQVSSTGIPETAESHEGYKTTDGSQNIMFDWIRYILYTAADEKRNQPLQNKTTGRHLRQGGSSWTSAPAAAVPAERTGTQPCTLQLRTSGPLLLQNSIQELVEQLERCDVSFTNHKCRTEAAHTLSYD